jgi:hypothetical protein
MICLVLIIKRMEGKAYTIYNMFLNNPKPLKVV